MIKLVRAEPQNVIGYHFCDYVMLYDKRGAYHLVLVVKNLPANTGDKEDLGLISGLGRFPGGGHGNPLQYSCLDNPIDRGAW